MGAICALELSFVKGTYTLLIQCKRPMEVMFGRLGYARVEVGYYVYTGSALGRGALSVEGRLNRHFRRAKKVRWHVDYLTTRKNCVVSAAVYLRSGRRLECLINRRLFRALNAKTILPHLGATDCTCPAHLLQVRGSRSVLAQVVRIYARFGEPYKVEREASVSQILATNRS
jgi:Uri superfamily endonuclease